MKKSNVQKTITVNQLEKRTVELQGRISRLAVDFYDSYGSFECGLRDMEKAIKKLEQRPHLRLVQPRKRGTR